jgi:hypothetical protein
MTPLPFWNDSDQSHLIVAQIYAHRQNHFRAATSNMTETPLVLAVFAGEGSISGPSEVVGARGEHISAEIAKPPKIADSLIRICAKSVHDEAEWGDMREEFASNCTTLGNAEATRLYWLDTLGYLLRHRPRTLKWAALFAALVEAFKRLIG